MLFRSSVKFVMESAPGGYFSNYTKEISYIFVDRCCTLLSSSYSQILTVGYVLVVIAKYEKIVGLTGSSIDLIP